MFHTTYLLLRYYDVRIIFESFIFIHYTKAKREDDETLAVLQLVILSRDFILHVIIY